MEELVSVIIPTYNRRGTIVECLDSVLNQTYSNLEIIVVDDASDDETFKIFEKITDSRVHFYRYEENRGACYARNYGIRFAKGDYIAFQDSDDLWMPQKLVKQMDYLKKKNADFVFCGMNRIDPMRTQKFYYPMKAFDENRDAVEQLLVENVISTQTMLMKKEICEKIKFDETFKRFQDWDFALRVAMEGFRIVYLSEALVDSTVQANSLSAKATNSKMGMAYEHLFEKYKLYYSNYPHAQAMIYMYQARGYRGVDWSKTNKYLMLSMKSEANIKTFVKIVLHQFRMWK